MTDRVQLKDPGSSLVITVAKVNAETVGTDDYWLFTGDGKEVLVPQSSVTRQLDRLKAAETPELTGKTIKFSRSTGLSKYGKPYWNLDLATAEEKAKPGENSNYPKPPVEKPVVYAASKPNAELPPLLQNAEAEDAAELAAKVGPTREEALRGLKGKHAIALRQAVQYVLQDIEPHYREKQIGLTGDEVYKHAYTIFQTWEDKGLIE